MVLSLPLWFSEQVGKLSFFRQNAAIIIRKKEQTAERLNELRGELANYQEDMRVGVHWPNDLKNFLALVGLQEWFQSTVLVRDEGIKDSLPLRTF